jgi:hypothetical protein
MSAIAAPVVMLGAVMGWPAEEGRRCAAAPAAPQLPAVSMGETTLVFSIFRPACVTKPPIAFFHWLVSGYLYITSKCELAALLGQKKISRQDYIEELDRALAAASRSGEDLMGFENFHRVFGELTANQLGDVTAFVEHGDDLSQ